MPTLIALLIFAAWFAFAWLKPRTAFSFLPFALPFYLLRLKIGPLPTTALEMVVLATVAGWVIREAGSGKREAGTFKRRLSDAWTAFRPWRIPVALWLLAGVISVIVPADHVAALGLYRAYFIEPVIIFFVGIAMMNGEGEAGPRPYDLVRNLFILTIILGVWAIFQYMTGIGLPAEYAPAAIRRSVGPFPYPNALALFVAPIVALAFAWIVASRESRVASSLKNPSTLILPPWLGWTTVIAGVIAIILAKSDGGLIAVIAAMGVTLVMNTRTRVATVAVAVIGAIAIFAIPQVRTPVLDQLLFREWSGKVRVIMWKETVTMLKDRPVFGAGLAAYPTAIKPYHKATWMEIFQYPHDILLNLWSETGVLGVVAFGWILWRWTSGCWLLAAGRTYSGQQPEARSQKPFSNSVLTLPIITALLVHGIVDVPYFKNDLAIAFWLLILITLGETCASSSLSRGVCDTAVATAVSATRDPSHLE